MGHFGLQDIPPVLFAWSYVRDIANEKEQQINKWIEGLYNKLIVDDNCLEWKAGSVLQPRIQCS